MRVAIVTSDLRGPIKCGGVGTAYSELARTLVAQGHAVTVYFLLIPGRPVKDFARHQKLYQNEGIRLEVLKNPAVPVDGPEVVREAYAVYLNLNGTKFDLIHFPDMHGLGFFCMAAKRSGLSFQNTRFAVILNGPSHWHKWGNRQFLDSLIDLQYLHLERKSVEWADELISPSQHALDWARNEGWVLPKQSQVIQYPYTAPLQHLRESMLPQEIVFFGRLETRKGLDLFVDALETMDPTHLQGKKVVFLGKSGIVENGESAADFIQRRSAFWTFHWEMKTDLGQEEAIRYLTSKNAFAVIPSRDETLGYTVMECLGNQIPFLALDIPPFRELVDPADAERVLTSEETFAARLVEKISTRNTPAQFRVSPEVTLGAWKSFHGALGSRILSDRGTSERVLETKDVTVVVLHKDRPEFLEQCLESLRAQSVAVKICLVDNGSQTAAAVAYVESLRSAPDVDVVLIPDAVDPAEARNRAARLVQTEWILWMDDDNVFKPGAVQAFITAGAKSGSPFVTCALDCFESRKNPLKEGVRVSYRSIFMGSDPAHGFFRNIFGDTTSLMDREVFLALGGFKSGKGLGNEDWEFFSRASLAGHEIVVVPEALTYYRLSAESRSQTMSAYASERFRRSPYESGGEIWLRGLLELSFGLIHANTQAAGSVQDQRRSKALAASTPILGKVEDDLYQDRIRPQGTLIFEAGPVTHFENVRSLWHCRLEKQNHSMRVVAEGCDPAVEIQVPYFQFGESLRVDIEIEVSKSTQLQVFYKIARSEGYDENRSVLVALRAGFQEVSEWLPENCVGDTIRIDPVCEEVDSQIEGIRVYALSQETEDLRSRNSSVNDRRDRPSEPHPTSADPELFL